MHKLLPGLLIPLAGLFATPLAASTATLTAWGTQANVVSGTCAGDNCTALDILLNPITSELSTGGVNELTATTGIVGVSAGTAQSSATVTGNLATPILKAQASANTDAWMGAAAFAIQGYEYTGAITDLVSLNILFDGTITNPDADTATGFGVAMYLFTPDQIDGSLLLNADPNDTFLALALASFSLSANQIYELNVTDDGAVNESGSLSMELNPGDQFYIAGGVLASAGGNGAIADAFSTLTVEIDPKFTSSLDSASPSAVPLPASIWLLMSALFGIAGLNKFNFYQNRVTNTQ